MQIAPPQALLTMQTVQGSFCVLVGPSGSAKSSVLAAILGDMLLTGGVCEVCGTCALAPQEPWLIADTIRDNIVMGSQANEQRYQMVRTYALVHPLLSEGAGSADRRRTNLDPAQRLASSPQVYASRHPAE